MPFDYEKYTHDTDRAALKALKAIPGFSPLLKAFMKVWNERQQKILNMSSRIRISEKQMKKYYDMLPPICEKLGIAVPELYLEMNPVPNAYTSGDTEPFIVVTSGLLKSLPPELVPSVLAHECGHIACHHVLYLTMGRIVLQGAGSVLSGVMRFGSLLTVPLQIAFYYWMRCSEFSADRAAVLCDGTDRKMQEVCMRLAGWDKDIDAEVNLDAFLEQASGYREMIDESKWNKALEYMILSGASHPLMAVRALECRNWFESEAYRAVTGSAASAPAAAAGDSVPVVHAVPVVPAVPVKGTASGSLRVVLPRDYQPLQAKATDPEGSAAYGHVSTQADCFVQVAASGPEDELCGASAEDLVRWTRRSLSEDDGLIAVGCGATAGGKDYAYTLIKTRHDSRSVEYRLAMEIADGDSAASLRGYFMETGSPGFREASVRGQLKRELDAESAADLMLDWRRDPYDPSFTVGFLMNESEKEKYDSRFPLHPLSEARKFIASVIAEN